VQGRQSPAYPFKTLFVTSSPWAVAHGYNTAPLRGCLDEFENADRVSGDVACCRQSTSCADGQVAVKFGIDTEIWPQRFFRVFLRPRIFIVLESLSAGPRCHPWDSRKNNGEKKTVAIRLSSPSFPPTSTVARTYQATFEISLCDYHKSAAE